jgi:hypothetical protein
MKAWEKWGLIIGLMLFTTGVLFNLKTWAHEWQNYFFFTEDWTSLIFVFVLVYLLGHLIKHILIWALDSRINGRMGRINRR